MRIAILIGVVCGLAATARAQDKAIIPTGDVPGVVIKAIGAAAPKTKWLIAKTWEEKDKTVFALLGTDAKSRVVAVMALEDGTVIDVRTEVEVTGVPHEKRARS